MHARTTTLLAVGVLLALSAGCKDKSVALEEKLAEKRFERQGLFDDLYATYGKGELAEAVHKKALKSAEESAKEEKTQEDKDVAREFLTALSSAALEMDRSAFESHCIAMGKGERPSILSPKARTFFAQKSTLSSCRDISKVQFEIEGLELELKQLGKTRQQP